MEGISDKESDKERHYIMKAITEKENDQNTYHTVVGGIDQKSYMFVQSSDYSFK